MWEVVGFTSTKNEQGEITSFTLHCKRPLKAQAGTGEAVRQAWFRPTRIAYYPSLGDKIFIEEQQFGDRLYVTDIVVM